jgi:hypothetical protein
MLYVMGMVILVLVLWPGLNQATHLPSYLSNVNKEPEPVGGQRLMGTLVPFYPVPEEEILKIFVTTV